jgi:hypothetical protein
MDKNYRRLGVSEMIALNSEIDDNANSPNTRRCCVPISASLTTGSRSQLNESGLRRSSGTKKIEYRQIKPYWTKRFKKVSMPFELRLLNGMNPPVPEVTVLIHKIVVDRRAREYQLHINKVLGFKHWDKRRQKPR